MAQSSTTLATPRLQRLFKDYAEAHRTPGNKITHYIGIPLITMTLLGLLGQLPVGDGLTGYDLFRVDGGTILWFSAFIIYLLLDWKIALPFGAFVLGLYWFGRFLPLPLLWGLFIFGWVAQFWGHYHYEKKSPKFFTNLLHIFIGPLWIFARVVGYIQK